MATKSASELAFKLMLLSVAEADETAREIMQDAAALLKTEDVYIEMVDRYQRVIKTVVDMLDEDTKDPNSPHAALLRRYALAIQKGIQP